MLPISVIICTHNPREHYLRRVLDALLAQTLPKNQWELLLVDNASAKPLASKWNLTWHPQARHLREDKIGLTHARLCGITAAQGEILVFVDDDNVLRQDYLQNALKISADYPRLGAWGGSCVGEFEVEPPAELRPWLAGLVVDPITEATWAKMRVGSSACPAGAGLVLRQKLARHYRDLALREPLRQALGRSGKTLASGEDSDMVLCGFDLGLGAGRFPELELIHLIPAQRVTAPYMERLYRGFGASGVILGALHRPAEMAPPSRWQPVIDYFWRIGLVLSGAGWTASRIRWANRRGRWLALRELQKSGFFDRQPSASSPLATP